MGRVIALVAGAVLIVAIITVAILVINRRASRARALEQGLPVKGDMSGRQERQLLAANQAATSLFRRLLESNLVLDSTYVSDADRKEIEAWLTSNAVTITMAATTRKEVHWR